MLLTGSGQPAHGWLVVGSDATIVTADASACLLLGVRGPVEVQGHTWTSLVIPAEDTAIAEATAAIAAGRSWRGVLTFIGASSSQPVEAEIVPTEAAGGVALMHLHASAALTALQPHRPSDHAVLEAQVEALEAIAAMPEAHAASRGVLSALRGLIGYDWGTVIRFARDAHMTQPGAEVVAVYPSPMAGVDRGTLWTPLDVAQAGVLSSGEPELSTQLMDETGLASPLRRLPAFGLTSRIHVPLYHGADIAGCLVVYSAGEPLTMYDGMAIERVSRSLGPLITSPLAAPYPYLRAEPQGEVPHAAAPAASTTPPPSPHDVHDVHVAASNLEAAGGATARLSALSEVISGVAHELNNPLTAILGYAQIFDALDGAEREHAVNTIEREAQRAARIVRNLLSFARQEPAQATRVDVEETIGRVIEVMRYSLEVDNIRTELRFAGVPEVEADRAQLEQAFLNLVNNAQQALQPGGGEIVITTSHSADFVRVSIADDGPGVPADVRDRVFEPFFTTREVGLGQGMGLSTVYGVISQHGGRVWVEASVSGGADFIIELPVHHGAGTDRSTSVPASPRVGGERILVVDDELPIRALTSEILSHAGYLVTTAASGDEALHRLEIATYDLVIADMRMPGMDGATLYDQICERWPQMDHLVVFITGDVEGERTSRRLARGDVRYLEKPFDTNALLGTVRAALEART